MPFCVIVSTKNGDEKFLSKNQITIHAGSVYHVAVNMHKERIQNLGIGDREV